MSTSPAHESPAAMAGRVCGICERPLGKCPVDLNNVKVCRRCRGRFVSLRQIAFFFDWLCFFLVSRTATTLILPWWDRLLLPPPLDTYFALSVVLRVFLVGREFVGGVSLVSGLLD